MKRAGRWFFNFAAAVSLLLCTASAVLWLRSYWHCDAIGIGSATWYAQIITQDGELVTLTEWNTTGTVSTGFAYQHEQIAPFGYTVMLTYRGPTEWAGFRFQRFDRQDIGYGSSERTIPLWFAVIVTAAAPISRAIARRPSPWLFSFAAAVSGTLCIALVVLGIRSFMKVGSLAIDHRAGPGFWVEIERGRIGVWKQRRVAAATQPAPLLSIRSGEKLASVRPKNVITSSMLGFGAGSVSRAPFDASVAGVAKLRQQADSARSTAEADEERARLLQEGVELGLGNRYANYEDRRRILQRLQQQIDQMAVIRYTDWQVSVPMWAPLLCLICLTWIPYLFMAKRWKVYKRKKLGQCLACGYDLRATPEAISRYPLNYACQSCGGRGY